MKNSQKCRVLLLLLALKPYMGFGLLHQSFQAFLSLTSWIQFLSFSFFISLLHLCNYYGVPIGDLLNLYHIFHSVQMSPPFYSFCSYIFNNIFSFYLHLQFVITSDSPSFLKLNWSKYLP